MQWNVNKYTVKNTCARVCVCECVCLDAQRCIGEWESI